MNEQLEQPIEGGTGEVLPEAAVSPAGEEAAEEKAGEAGTPEAEVNTESSAEENNSDAELSASEEANKPSPGGEDHDARPDVRRSQLAGSLQGLTDEVSPPAGDVPPRNYYAEWQELAEAHPEVVGKELPEDIYQACMQSELPPLRVYESMMLQKQAEQISALQQEIATLRQNAENSARAPVMAAAGGLDSEPEDLFLKGFNSY